MSKPPPPPAPTINARIDVTPLGTVQTVAPVCVNVRTQSPPGATVIVTPVALSTSVVHVPDETVAALTDVEDNPTVIEATKTNRQTSGLAKRLDIIGTLDIYAVRILRRRRSCVGKRKPKPIANVIGIAISTRVRVDVVEISPTKIPRVNVVGLPFGNLAEMTTR
jgi:hypothetical protein